MKRSKTLFTIGAIFVVVIIAFSLIRHDQNKNTEDTMVTVKIADLPVVHALPFYIALEKGYFRDEGIKAERVKLGSPNLIIDALLSNNVDMSATSGALGIAGITSTKQPGKLKLYAVSGESETSLDGGIVVPIDSEIFDISMLQNKKLGILPGIQWRTIAKHIVAQRRLETEKDVVLVELAPGLQAPALYSGQIDALLGVEPLLTIIKEKGIGKDLDPQAAATYIGSPFYPGAGIVRTEFAHENPEIFAKALRAIRRGLDDMRENPQEARQYLKGYTPLDDDLINKAPIMGVKMYDEINEHDMRGIQAFYDIFLEHSVVDTRIDASTMFYEPTDK